MLGTVYKFDRFSITFLQNGCCTTKLHRVVNNKFKNLNLEVGKQVSYETTDAEPGRLQSLEFIEEAVFDNCPKCWLSTPLTDAQPPPCECAMTRDLISDVFKVTDCEERFYNTGTGFKVSMQTDPKTNHKYHAVFYSGTVFHELVKELREGDRVRVRGEFTTQTGGTGHSLLNVFYIGRI